jgi:hypothetical protein
LHVYNSNFKQSIRFLATITMKHRLHGCRIVNMQKYVGAVRHRGLALRVAAIRIFYVSTVRLVCAQTVPSPPWWKDYSLRPIVTNAVQWRSRIILCTSAL